MTTQKCWKCGGHGYIEAYSGIRGGVCFSCNGSGRKAYNTSQENKRPSNTLWVEITEDNKDSYECVVKKFYGKWYAWNPPAP